MMKFSGAQVVTGIVMALCMGVGLGIMLLHFLGGTGHDAASAFCKLNYPYATHAIDWSFKSDPPQFHITCEYPKPEEVEPAFFVQAKGEATR